MSDEKGKIERLNHVVACFLNPLSSPLSVEYFAAFDLKRPNIHDSKAEFVAEKRAVEQSIRNCTQLFDFLTAAWESAEPLHNISKRVCALADSRSQSRLKGLPVRYPSDLARKNASEVGLTKMVVFAAHDLRIELDVQLQELRDQEIEFWSDSSRPPNHFARTIALRLARFIVKETGQFPTIGASRDGAHTSTNYGRALEETYQILGIRANYRRAGTWAISQLSEQDLRPRMNALAALSMSDERNEVPTNALVELYLEVECPH